MSHLRHRSSLRIFYRGLVTGLVMLLCLPPPDLLAASSSRSIFSNRQAGHATIQQRNLRELEAKQGMLKQRTGDKEQGTNSFTVHSPSSTEKPKLLNLASLQDLSAIAIPSDDGQVLEVWTPATSEQGAHPTVILLQDLHTQPDAQLAEGRILQHLYKMYNVRAVAMEGATGPLDLAFFQWFPKDAQVRELLANTFLSVGEMTGPEYQIVTQRLPLALYGIEEEALHTANGEAFVQVLDAAPPAQAALTQLQQALDALKPELYPQTLQGFEQQAQGFQQGQMPLPDYVAQLLAHAQQQQVDAAAVAPNLQRLVQLQQQEATFDRSQLEPQFQQLLAVLAERHSSDGFSTRSARSNQNEIGSASSEGTAGPGVEKSPQTTQGRGGTDTLRGDLDTLLGQFQAQQLAPARFYPQLLALAQQAGMEVAVYPALTALAAYLQTSAQLQQHRILPELEALQLVVAEAMAGSADARMLVQLSHRARVLHDFFALKLTPDQLAEYEHHRQEFTGRTFLDFLDKQSLRHGLIGFSTRPSPALGTRSNENRTGFTSSEVIRHRSLAENVVEKLPLDAVIDARLPLVEQFYALAHQRDRVLLNNTLRWLEDREAHLVKREASRDRGAGSVPRGASDTPTVAAAHRATPTSYDVRRTTHHGRRPWCLWPVASTPPVSPPNSANARFPMLSSPRPPRESWTKRATSAWFAARPLCLVNF